MREIDYDYIAENISNLSRINLRVYENKELKSFYNTSSFPVDPGAPYIDELLQINKSVGYYITPFYQYYGVINHMNHTLIIGPSYQLPPSHSQIRDYMFLLGIKENYKHYYKELLSSITPMPLELFLHLLCMVNYYISDEKLSVAQILLYDSSSKIHAQELVAHQESQAPDFIDYPHSFVHDTYGFEKQMLGCISSGDLEGLDKLFTSTSPGQAGKMASNYLRQLKNLFVASTTLVSRAAIEGGMPPDEALSLSDRYIQHSEKYNEPEQILNLQHHMVLDYATQVHELTKGNTYNHFMRTIATYVHDHLTEDVSVDQMAKDLFMSRSHLSTKFKQESGMTLSAFIQQQKIKKAKEYLKNSKRSILEISTILGFSSQGYFQNVFKKTVGMTPKEYREQ
jgi:AraC-like DNA-binding protein